MCLFNLFGTIVFIICLIIFIYYLVKYLLNNKNKHIVSSKSEELLLTHYAQFADTANYDPEIHNSNPLCIVELALKDLLQVIPGINKRPPLYCITKKGLDYVTKLTTGKIK